MIDVYSYVPNHLLAMDLAPELDFVKEQVQDPEIRYAGWAPGIGQSLFREGKPIVCYGCEPQRPNVAFLWVVIDKTIGPMDFQRIYHTYWAAWLEQAGRIYPRLEAVTPVGYENAERLVTVAGFTFEGVARKWDGERDFKMWAKVR